MIFPRDKIGSYLKCFQREVNETGKIQPIMLSEKTGCESVCLFGSQF